MKKYDYLIVGSGFFGATFAYQMKQKGKKCLILEKRNHIGGNTYTHKVEGIDVHTYGPHFFHTNNEEIWNFVNKFTKLFNYYPKVKVNYQDKIYSFPINLFTLNQLWGILTPKKAIKKIREVRVKIKEPKNLEEWALSKIGRELYEIFYKGYTEKQWGRPCTELPATIIKRVPIRFTYNDSVHSNCKFQGIPSNGFTEIFDNMLKGIEVKLETDFFEINDWKKIAKKLVYSGPIDQFYNYEFGQLEYRSLKHKTKVLKGDFQGNHQINYTEAHIPYTRIIEHKHFNPFKEHDNTVVTWEYPEKYKIGANEPFYPIGDESNLSIYHKYHEKVKNDKDIIIGGRLGSYKYLDMDQTIAEAFHEVEKEIG